MVQKCNNDLSLQGMEIIVDNSSCFKVATTPSTLIDKFGVRACMGKMTTYENPLQQYLIQCHRCVVSSQSSHKITFPLYYQSIDCCNFASCIVLLKGAST